MTGRIQNNRVAIESYQARFWKALAEIIEAAKPLIITAIEEKMNDERERLQHRNPRGR